MRFTFEEERGDVRRFEYHDGIRDGIGVAVVGDINGWLVEVR